jgi:DNA-directed RNA polymerase subunit H (RpoH/RPB5)
MDKAQSDKKETETIVPQLLPIEKNSETRKNIVLTNIIKMLTERKLLKEENLKQNIANIISIQSDDLIYKIDLDYPESNTDSKIFYVILFHQKITSLTKSSSITDFLNQYKTFPKLIVALNVSMKLIYNIKNDTTYPNTEIFLEKELMTNLVDHIPIPKHILLSEQELKAVIESYYAKRREIPEILITDPVSRYYNVKLGQMFRIIRPSETAGFAPYYRLVIKGNIIQI